MPQAPILLDSITDATAAISGKVVISGSHGGHYPAALASEFSPRAVLFHDAGIGLDEAGVAGVMALGTIGMAAAAISHESCTIGSAEAMLVQGIISRPNGPAAARGLRPGMAAREAARLLQAADLPTAKLPPATESRRWLDTSQDARVLLVDSASLVRSDDAGALIVTGSHGGLIGGNPARALKARARAAAFNDAGFGTDDIATSRLPALDDRGVAAVLVSCHSAHIGEATSAYETGTISYANTTATTLGATPGLRLKTWLAGLE